MCAALYALVPIKSNVFSRILVTCMLTTLSLFFALGLFLQPYAREDAVKRSLGQKKNPPEVLMSVAYFEAELGLLPQPYCLRHLTGMDDDRASLLPISSAAFQLRTHAEALQTMR